MKSFFLDLFRKFALGAAFMAGALAMALAAQTVTGNVSTFNAGDTLSAEKINENFASLKSAIESISIPTVPDTGWTLSSGLSDRGGPMRVQNNGASVYFQPASAGSVFDINWYDATDTITSGAFRWNLTYRAALSAHELILQRNGGFQVIQVDQLGRVGLGINPGHSLHLASGAHVTGGGVWTNGSSRASKKSIRELDERRALSAFRLLKPVSFEYRKEPGNQYLGFIAEDVPALVATPDRKGVAAMDIAALLTRVVQEQDRRLNRQAQAIRELKRRVGAR